MPDPLSAPLEPSVFEQMGLGTRGPGPFAKALAGTPGVVVLPYDSEAARDEAGFEHSLAALVARANEVGAKVDVLSSGRGARSALKAAAELETTGAGKARIRRLVTAGYDERRLKKSDPGFFAEFQPSAVVDEWANVWAERRDEPRGIGMSYYGEGLSSVGFVDAGRLSAGTYAALMRGAREEGYDAAVRELAGLLASLGAGAASLRESLTPSGKVPAFAHPPATALAPPERVFRSVAGAASRGSGVSPQAGSAAPVVEQRTGYKAEEASAPDVESLRRDRSGKAAPESAAASARSVLPTDDPKGGEEAVPDFSVPQIVACAEDDACRTSLPKRAGILGYLRKHETMGSTWMYLLCEGNMGIRSQCVTVASLCQVRDGHYRMVGDVGRYRPRAVLEGTRDCSSFKRFD
ncbi:MAG: hypothetical protein WC969_03515 [Elusimicrobiota bacterium]